MNEFWERAVQIADDFRISVLVKKEKNGDLSVSMFETEACQEHIGTDKQIGYARGRNPWQEALKMLDAYCVRRARSIEKMLDEAYGHC